MEPLRRAPLADQAAELLLARIRAGEWALGQKLPGETTLAPQLGVGRSTVREAIRQLAGRGVLASRQGAGVFVTALDAREDWDAVLLRSGIVAVLEARAAIETEAAALAAARRTPADLRAIRRALAGRGERRTEIAAHVDADTALHRSIVAAAHNEILLELFDGFTPRVRKAMIEMLRIRADFGSDSDHAAHEELVAAVTDRDADRAASLSRAHLRSLTEALT
ncbi:FadR/GntR family transcriptional regulator [Leucobacter luti]|uniref:DNA-binding FadR family transcriptional regulator n=1 Tax=Leucobacter luti TaxID=340320 RepID=A0A4Q7U9J1_9MICO|nr:FCD domain-containing protein [Leucobacter luti]MBL3700910.1 FadR family transcriptional regulator [Leucobacter luti]RZT68872.1 DNA-binding FadR family transcriptional regulator [Leucobacter luti]